MYDRRVTGSVNTRRFGSGTGEWGGRLAVCHSVCCDGQITTTRLQSWILQTKMFCYAIPSTTVTLKKKKSFILSYKSQSSVIFAILWFVHRCWDTLLVSPLNCEVFGLDSYTQSTRVCSWVIL